MSEPAYLALADELAALVARLEPGDRMPSEHDLVEAHRVSRLTARAALQELEQRFLVRRVRGAGTFVARRIEHRVSPDMPPSGSDAVRRAGAVPGNKVVSARTRRPSAAVRDALDLGPDDRVNAISRAGTVDGFPASYGTTHIPVDVAPELSRHLDDDTSIYAAATSSSAAMIESSFREEVVRGRRIVVGSLLDRRVVRSCGSSGTYEADPNCSSPSGGAHAAIG